MGWTLRPFLFREDTATGIKKIARMNIKQVEAMCWLIA
jgi:hypothetical protein